jgi:hypothetical protein
VNQIVPSLLTTMSFGELNGRPCHASTTVSVRPVAGSSAAMRVAVSNVPCSQTSRRPSRPSVIPFAMFASSRTRVTVPVATSSRLMSTRRSRQRREVQRALGGDVDRPLVRVDLDEPLGRGDELRIG